MQAQYGVSKVKDTTTATQEALQSCLANFGEEKPIGAFIFWGSNHDPKQVAAVVAEKIPGLPVIGCSTDGEITSDGLAIDSVCAMVIGSNQVTARAIAVSELSGDSEQAGKTLATRLANDDAKLLLLLPDGLTGNGSAIIRGALEVLGEQFVIAGGTAGDQG